jgi:hypothetical protein
LLFLLLFLLLLFLLLLLLLLLFLFLLFYSCSCCSCCSCCGQRALEMRDRGIDDFCCAQVNYLGAWLLIETLAPALLAARPDARVVMVNSDMHLMLPANWRVADHVPPRPEEYSVFRAC